LVKGYVALVLMEKWRYRVTIFFISELVGDVIIFTLWPLYLLQYPLIERYRSRSRRILKYTVSLPRIERRIN
jgi:hypothetical protein